MSSAAYITLEQPVPLAEWQAFSRDHGIVHSPRTVGGNVFYRGEVEISVQGGPPLRTDGLPDPVGYVRVGTFFMVTCARWPRLPPPSGCASGGR